MNSNQTMVKMVFDRWNSLLKSFDTTLNSFTDEQLEKETAPGKNRGIYLLGHLIAVHDAMLPLLDLGSKQYPELHKIFIESTDKTISEIPSAKELRAFWNAQKESLTEKFNKLSADEWFEKHTSVSAEDFAKEPYRNKLNIILTRASHLAYHQGQFMLLK